MFEGQEAHVLPLVFDDVAREEVYAIDDGLDDELREGWNRDGQRTRARNSGTLLLSGEQAPARHCFATASSIRWSWLFSLDGVVG